jgi:hypothetical protein
MYPFQATFNGGFETTACRTLPRWGFTALAAIFLATLIVATLGPGASLARAATSDRYEYDDSPGSAKPIANFETQTRSIHRSGDVDWAYFFADRPCQITIETSGYSGDTELWLYGPGNATALRAYDDDGNGLFSRISLSLQVGLYYVKVTSYRNSSTIDTYRLLVMASQAATSAPAQATMPRVATPTFSPAPPQTFANTITVSISCATSGATIRYTTNGTDPTSSSTAYSGPLTFSATTTLKARAFKSGMTDSAVASGTYTKSAPPSISLPEAIDQPTWSVPTGGSANWFGEATTYYYGNDAAQSGVITHNQESWMQTTVSGAGTVSFYWKVSSEGGWDYLEFYDGSTWLAQISGEVNWQEKVFTISGTGTRTLKWRYVKDGSVVAGQDRGWVDYVRWTAQQAVVATPTFSPAPPQTFTNTITVSISCSGATIRYTTNGTDPTASSTVYSGPLTFTATTTLKARGFKSGMIDSAVASGVYTKSGTVGDAYEVDDTPAQAKTITSGQTQNRSIHAAGNVDWVKFTLTQTSAVVIDTNGPSGDTQMWLYGPNSSTSLAPSPNYSDDAHGYWARIEHPTSNPLMPGDYYIKITEYNNDETIPSYALSLPTVTPVTARGRVLRYDGTPIPGAIVSFANITVTRTTDANGYFDKLGTVLRIKKYHAGYECWQFRQSDAAGFSFEGAYVKRIRYQQGGYDIADLLVAADLFGASGLGTALASLLELTVGVQMIQDYDDVLGITEDGRTRWMTGWSRIYVKPSLSVDVPLTNIDAEFGWGTMFAKDPDHDPVCAWQLGARVAEISVFTQDWALLSSSVAFGDGRLSMDPTFRLNLLSFTIAGVDLSLNGRDREYNTTGRSTDSVVGLMALRTATGFGPLGSWPVSWLLDQAWQALGLDRPVTGTSNSGWPCP